MTDVLDVPAAEATPDAQDRSVSIRRDLPALGLVAITLLTLVAVITHDAGDPLPKTVWPLDRFVSPQTNAYPLNETVQNACGSLGALLSATLLSAVGIGSALLIGAGGGVATALLVRGSMNAPALRSFGGCVTLLAVCTAASMTDVKLAGMPVVGNGGYLGAMGSAFLLQHFHPIGSWILTLTALAAGALMTTDYMLVDASRKMVAGGAKVSKKGLSKAAHAMPAIRRRRQPFTDLDSPILVDGEVPPVPEKRIDPPQELPPPVENKPEEPTIKFRQAKRTEEQEEQETASPTKPAKSGLAKAAAGLAVAAGLGRAEADHLEDDEYDEEEWEEDEEIDHDEESLTREIEYEDETVRLRQDNAHEEDPMPTIKMPKQRDAKQELYDSVRESAPEEAAEYFLPSLELLEGSDGFDYEEQRAEALQKSSLLQRTIQSFGYKVRVTNVEIGPVIAQYELELEAGLRLNKISALADDLAIALRVPSVRVVAPIPGKNTVGIEVPNETRQVVRLRDVIEESDSRIEKMNIPVFLGKDVSGEPMPVDLAKMPHLVDRRSNGYG